MATTPASVQEVRYTTEVPQQNAFLAFLQGGLTGALQGMQEKRQRQLEEEQFPKELIKSAFASWASTKQLQPTAPGEKGLYPNVPYKLGSQQLPAPYSDVPGVSDWASAQQYENTMADLALRSGKLNPVQAYSTATRIVQGSPSYWALPPEQQDAAITRLANQLYLQGLQTQRLEQYTPQQQELISFNQAKHPELSVDEIISEAKRQKVWPE